MTTLTDVEKIRRLPWLLAADTLNMMFFSISFTGPVFLLFLDELSLNEGQIGFLLSLIPFCGIVAPFVAPTVARFGYKRVQGDLPRGTNLLKDIIYQLLKADIEHTLACILHECASSLAEFGSTRLEFILLSLHTLTIALPQLNSTRSNYPN